MINSKSKSRYLISTILFVLLFAGISSAESPVELNNKGVQLMNKGDLENALTYLLKARDAAPTDDSIGKNLANCYTFIGNKKMADGRISDALSEFRSAIYYHDNPDARFYKGYAHYRLKEFDEAIYELEKAINSGFSSADIYSLTGKAYYDKGEMLSAITSWNKGLELYPDNVGLRELLDKANREARAEDGFKKGSTSHFTVQFEAEKDEALADTILGLLEDAYSDVNLDLAHYPSGNTIVVLYGGKGFKEATQSPDWSGGLYDGKIRLPVGGVKDVSAQLKAVIYHEYAHVVVRSITGGKMAPTWLNEGIAEYEGARFLERRMKELARAAKKGELIPVKMLEGSFSGLSGKESSLAYLQSYSLVKYMIDRFGFHAVRDILENMAAGNNIETALKKALDPYGLDYASLLKEWEGTLK
mgnify:CR=1 FL=1